MLHGTVAVVDQVQKAVGCSFAGVAVVKHSFEKSKDGDLVVLLGVGVGLLVDGRNTSHFLLPTDHHVRRHCALIGVAQAFKMRLDVQPPDLDVNQRVDDGVELRRNEGAGQSAQLVMIHPTSPYCDESVRL